LSYFYFRGIDFYYPGECCAGYNHLSYFYF
jgi:hypothetical protein